MKSFKWKPISTQNWSQRLRNTCWIQQIQSPKTQLPRYSSLCVVLFCWCQQNRRICNKKHYTLLFLLKKKVWKILSVIFLLHYIHVNFYASVIIAEQKQTEFMFIQFIIMGNTWLDYCNHLPIYKHISSRHFTVLSQCIVNKVTPETFKKCIFVLQNLLKQCSSPVNTIPTQKWILVSQVLNYIIKMHVALY